MHVYLASYTEKGDSMVPDNFDRLMTLIFAPADIDKHDIGDYYYTIVPGEIFNEVTCKLPTTIKDAWIGYYNDKKLHALDTTIDLTDGDNRANGKVSDTRSILYDFDFIKELCYEMSCQHASGIEADFASYTNKGKEDSKGKYKKRLHIQFELTQRIGNRDEIFYIEETDGFEHRHKPQTLGEEYLSNKKKLTPEQIKEVLRMFTFNNGQLCPPTCP